VEHDQQDGQAKFALPTLISSPSDLSHVHRELESLDNYLEAQRLREPGMPMDRLPKLSRLLNELVELNHLNLLHRTVRQDLEQYLETVRTQAPVIHVSFASDPSSALLQKIVVWLRGNIRPDVLVRVGLQPGIVAGCVVWTTNQYFDFSLRKHLQDQLPYLLDALVPRAEEPATNEAPHG
jgi:hypothetical protein